MWIEHSFLIRVNRAVGCLVAASLLLALSSVVQAQARRPGGKPPPPPPVTDPTVLALLETQPSTPPQLVRAIDVMINLKHTAAARPFINQLAAAGLDDNAMYALATEFGMAMFLRFSVQEELNPEATQFHEELVGAVNKVAHDPQRIAGLIADLSDPSPTVRSRAVLALRAGGPDSVAALIGVLADVARAAEHEVVRAALVGQGAVAVAPLIGALESAAAGLASQVVTVLRGLQASDSAIFLLKPALHPASSPELRQGAAAALIDFTGRLPNQTEAANALYSEARWWHQEALRRDPLTTEARTVWHWDAAKKQLVSQSLSQAQADRDRAVRLASNAYILAPRSIKARDLYLIALLEWAAHLAGLDQPLSMDPNTAAAEAAASGPDVLEGLLSQSIGSGHAAAATSAARILGRVGSPELLSRAGAEPSELVRAATHPDRRLRFAAVEAIMNLRPAGPYPGSSHVTTAITYFTATWGVPRVLVVDRHSQEAQRLAGMLAPLGFDTKTATHGRDFLLQAAASPDYELALVDFGLPSTDIDQLIQHLRHDHRTALLPVGLIVSVDDGQRPDSAVRKNALTRAVYRPLDADALQFQLEPLMAAAAEKIVPPDVRLAQAKAALGWLAELAATPQDIYHLRRTAASVESALFVPALSSTAAVVLADLGTPSGQRALVNLSSQLARPLAMRQAAAAAFRRSVDRYGILLTTGEMLAQYDRYNQSYTQPQESQDVLSSILDTLESKLPQ